MERASGLYRVGLRVSDIEVASSFYQKSWGMDLADGQSEERSLRSCGEDHADLILYAADGAGLDHIALEVESESSLRTLLKQIEDAGHRVVRPVEPGTRPGELLTGEVHDLDGNRLLLVVRALGEKGATPALSDGRPKRRLGHVVLWTTRVKEQEAFYASLGFQVSDRSHIGMSFLRCNKDHHSIALARSCGSQVGLQHVAYDIGTIDDVMREFGRLREDGVECIWGVGRHGPGNNVFSYYRDPAGNVIENYGDMEECADEGAIQARYWGPENRGDVWGVAGPPPMPFRG